MAGRLLTKNHSVNGQTSYEWDGKNCVREFAPGPTGTAIFDGAYFGADEYGWDGITNYYVVNGALRGVDFGGGTCAVIGDVQGNVRMLIDANSATVFSASYNDPWGASPLVTDDTPGMYFRYVGQLGVRTDLDTGLLYMRMRWYDAQAMQRFLGTDLVRSHNRYRYAGNRPVSLVDPSGAVTIDPSVFNALSDAGMANAGRFPQDCLRTVQFILNHPRGRSYDPDDPVQQINLDEARSLFNDWTIFYTHQRGEWNASTNSWWVVNGTTDIYAWTYVAGTPTPPKLPLGIFPQQGPSTRLTPVAVQMFLHGDSPNDCSSWNKGVKTCAWLLVHELVAHAMRPNFYDPKGLYTGVDDHYVVDEWWYPILYPPSEQAWPPAHSAK